MLSEHGKQMERANCPLSPPVEQNNDSKVQSGYIAS